MLHSFTLTLQPLGNSPVLNDLLSSSNGLRNPDTLENSCEAIYRILETVCHKNYTIVADFSVQLMVILMLQNVPPCSQHKCNLVHSQNYYRMHVCLRDRVGKAEYEQGLCYVIRSSHPSMAVGMVTWLCTHLKKC